ncbi:UNVERIFIED_CONTAM: Aspartyl protease family protein [Sesamum radiatum]|uniref:Aspartyl protease family protein n=1 Tax=Sesamum radiatum TaxID=300843 RepID=A0AAW2VNP6_SESRA
MKHRDYCSGPIRDWERELQKRLIADDVRVSLADSAILNQSPSSTPSYPFLPVTSGSLILGNDTSVYKNTTPISYTRLVPNPQLSSFYVLNLTGTSVGGVALSSPSFGKGGILIDSGTVITRLPPSIYEAIKAEFLKQFSGYPPAPSFSN